MSEVRLRVNSFVREEYGAGRTPDRTLELLVQRSLLVGSLVEQLIMKLLPSGDPTKYGLIVPGPYKWLSTSNQLSYYGLHDGDILDLCCKRRKVKIRTLDDSIRTVIVDETFTVGTIVEGACCRLGISNPEEYGLIIDGINPGRGPHQSHSITMKDKRSKDIQDPGFWLRSDRLMREQGAFEVDMLTLKRRFFFHHEGVDTSDPVQLNLLYSQMRLMIVGGKYPCTLEEACMFAAAQLQVEQGDYDPVKHKSLPPLHRLMPMDLVKSKDMKSMIMTERKKLVGLSVEDAKLHYIKLSRSLNSFGATTFRAEIVLSNKKNVPVFLSIAKDKLTLASSTTRGLISEWPLHHMRRWSVLFDTLTIDFGDYADNYLRLKCKDSETISELITGYINITLKRRCVRRKYRDASAARKEKLPRRCSYYDPEFKRGGERRLAGGHEVSGDCRQPSRDRRSDSIDTGSNEDSSIKEKGIGETYRRHLRSLENLAEITTGSSYAEENDPQTFGDEGKLLSCEQRRVYDHLSGALLAAKETTQVFRGKEFCSTSGSPIDSTEEDPEEKGVCPGGIVEVGGDEMSAARKEMEKQVFSSDINSVIVRISELALKVAKSMESGSESCSEDIIASTSTIVHLLDSTIRSFVTVTSGSGEYPKKLKAALLGNVDSFLSKSSALLEFVKTVSQGEFSIEENIRATSQLSHTVNAILEKIGVDNLTKKQQALVTEKSLSVIQHLQSFINQAKNTADTLELEKGENVYSLKKQIDDVNVVSGVPLSFFPGLAPVAHSYHAVKLVNLVAYEIRKSVKGLVTSFESREVPQESLKSLRNNSNEFLDGIANLQQLVGLPVRGAISESFVRFCLVRNKFDEITKACNNVEEFAERVNDLSLCTMNMFNALKAQEGKEKNKEEAGKFSQMQRDIAEIYATVMSCAREYSADMEDQCLREELSKAIDLFRDVVERVTEGGGDSGNFYNLHSVVRDIMASVNSLISNSKTSIASGISSGHCAKLDNATEEFARISPVITSSLKSYVSHPTFPGPRTRLLEAAKCISERIPDLLCVAGECSLSVHDPNIRRLMQRSVSETTSISNSLKEVLSQMSFCSTRINIDGSVDHLGNHLHDLGVAREKASSLLNLEGYGPDVASNDLQNSLRYVNTCFPQILSEFQAGDIHAASESLEKSISVLQFLSFATLGVCSAESDVELRCDYIDRASACGNLLLDISKYMKDAVDNPELCLSAGEKFSGRMGDVLRNLSLMDETLKGLLSASNACKGLLDISELAEKVGPSDISEEECIKGIKESVESLDNAVDIFCENLFSPVDGDRIEAISGIQMFIERFKESCATYFASIPANTPEEHVSTLKELFKDVGTVTESLIMSASDPGVQGGFATTKKLEYFRGSLHGLLEKIADICSLGPQENGGEMLQVNVITRPLRGFLIDGGDKQPSTPISVMTQDASTIFCDAIASLSKESEDAVSAVRSAISTISSMPPQDITEEDIGADLVVAGVSKVMEKLYNLTRVVEFVETSKKPCASRFSLSDGHMVLGMIAQAEESIDKQPPISGDVLVASVRGFMNDCSVVHRLCMDASSSTHMPKEDSVRFVNFCKSIENFSSKINEMLEVVEDGRGEDVENELRKQVSDSLVLLREVVAFSSSPRVCIAQSGLLRDTWDTREVFYKSANSLFNFSKDLLKSVNIYIANPSSENLGSAKEASESLILAIKSSSKNVSSISPAMSEYEKILKEVQSIGTCRAKVDEHSAFESAYKGYIDSINPQKDDLVDPEDVIDLTATEQFHKLLEPFKGMLGRRLLSNKEWEHSPPPLPFDATNLVSTGDLVSSCEDLVRCMLNREGDFVSLCKQILMLEKSVASHVDFSVTQSENVDSKNADRPVVRLLEDTGALMDGCKGVLAGDPDPATVENVNKLLEVVKESGRAVRDSSLKAWNKSVDAEVLDEVIKTITTSNEPSGDSRRVQKAPVVRDLFQKVVVQDKDELTSISNEVLVKMEKLSNGFMEASLIMPEESHTLPDVVKDLFKECVGLMKEVDGVLSEVSDPSSVESVNSCMKCLGFNLLNFANTKRAWDEELIPKSRAKMEISEHCTEIVSSINQLQKLTEKVMNELTIREGYVVKVEELRNNLNEKIKIADEGNLNPVNLIEGCTTYKRSVLHVSKQFVEKLRDLIEGSRARNVEDTKDSVEQVLNSLKDLSAEVTRCAAALTPLDKSGQVTMMEKMDNVCSSFSEMLRDATTAREEDDSGHKIQDNTNGLLMKNFEAVRELISSVKNCGEGSSVRDSVLIVESSEQMIKKSLSILERACVERGSEEAEKRLSDTRKVCETTELQDSGEVAENGTKEEHTVPTQILMSSMLHASKGLSSVLPEVVGLFESPVPPTQAAVAPVLNRINNNINELCNGVATCSSGLGKEVFTGLVGDVSQVCDKMGNVLGLVKDIAASGGNPSEKEKLREAMRNVNVAICSVVNKAEEHSREANLNRCNDPGVVAETELVSIRDIVEDAYTKLSVLDTTVPGKNSLEVSDVVGALDFNREVRTIAIMSLSILKYVSIACREIRVQTKGDTCRSKGEASERSQPNALIVLAKKLALVSVDICQLSATISSGGGELPDLVMVSRVALSSLKQLAANVKFMLPLKSKILTPLDDCIDAAGTALKKLISIASSSMMFDKAEGEFSRVVGCGGRDDMNYNGNSGNIQDGDDADYSGYPDVDVEGYAPVMVGLKIEEMNARIKVLRMEKELEDARKQLISVMKGQHKQKRT